MRSHPPHGLLPAGPTRVHASAHTPGQAREGLQSPGPEEREKPSTRRRGVAVKPPGKGAGLLRGPGARGAAGTRRAE